MHSVFPSLLFTHLFNIFSPSIRGSGARRETKEKMPEISRFLGIIIAMYYNDHGPPHFHAKYREHEALIVIPTGEVLAGQLPPHAFGLVEEWRGLHKSELLEDWELARDRKSLKSIEPLE
jgi:hypothetical protein